MKTAIKFLLSSALGLGLASSAPGQAVIEGTVKLPPAPAPAPSTARYQATLPGPVGAPEPPLAVVYLEGNFADQTNSAPPVAQMVQTNFQFSPALLAIRKGTHVTFPNRDDSYHNVFSYSKPKRFDLGRYRQEEQPAVQVFDQPGVIKLYCEIHEHMRATILVLETPHFTKTDPAGNFRLENLPAGEHTVRVWLNDKVRSATVNLQPDQTVRLDFASP